MKVFKLFINTFFISIIFSSICFAAPDVKITSPQEGTLVYPGEEITVTIEAVDGFQIREGDLGPFAQPEQNITSLPVTVKYIIPIKAVGTTKVTAIATDITGRYGVDEVILKVEQTATLQSLKVSPDDQIWYQTDWNGNIDDSSIYIGVSGVYSDGITRNLKNDPNTAFTSSNPEIILIDSKGKVTPHKIGDAKITVSNSGLSVDIPVVFEKPRGIRPSETIPPTTSIDIQPLANSAGWYNQDLTITLTAQDNEEGAGIQEVDWRFAGKAKGDYVNGDSAVVTYDLEGVKNFSYWSRDKEGNEDDNKIELRLDKTPPDITSTINLQPNSSGWNNTDVTVSFTATDKLSGIKSVTQPVTVAAEGANQTVTGEAIDIADNKSTASVTLNIDKTPPKLSITATPNILWSPNNKMVDVTIKGEATDNFSGIDSLTFKVSDEYGRCQPAITGFGSTIKLEASREGNDKDGRTYAISVTAKDRTGNESTTSAIVIVPHDQRKK